jgi:hypothetical protein
VITSGLRLALAPLILLGFAAITSALPTGRERIARSLAVLACGAALTLLISDVGVIASQGTVEAAFGAPLSGTSFLFRADSTGVALALIATSAALLALLEPQRSSGKSGAILLCAAGSWGAALGGSAVMLFAGLEAANVGSLLLMSRGSRPSHGTVAILVIQHLTSLGLLAAAVQLAVSTGTTDLAAAPAGAVTAAVGIPWALAGAARLVTPAIAPREAGGAWGAVAAIPCGAAVLLRLRNLAGPLPTSVIVVMAAGGVLVALWGALVAARSGGNAALAGRGLLLIGAGLPIAVVGMSAESAGSAAAAALCALELSAAASSLWAARAWTRAHRGLAAFALLVAGNLPIGFGLSAVVLVLGAAASLGLAGGPVVVGLGASVVAGVVASLRVAPALLQKPAVEVSQRVPPLAVVAVAVTAIAAVIPGAVAAGVLSALVPMAATTTADAAALRGPQGGWSGGYFVLAAAWLTIVAASVSTLAGRSPAPRIEAAALAAPPSPVAWSALLRGRRRIREPLRRLLEAARALDQWLVSQPRLPMVLVATALAVFFLH